MTELNYQLLDDGVQYNFPDDAISIRVRPKSPQRYAVAIGRDNVFTVNVGDIDSKRLRQ